MLAKFDAPRRILQSTFKKVTDVIAGMAKSCTVHLTIFQIQSYHPVDRVSPDLLRDSEKHLSTGLLKHTSRRAVYIPATQTFLFIDRDMHLFNLLMALQPAAIMKAGIAVDPFPVVNLLRKVAVELDFDITLEKLKLERIGTWGSLIHEHNVCCHDA